MTDSVSSAILQSNPQLLSYNTALNGVPGLISLQGSELLMYQNPRPSAYATLSNAHYSLSPDLSTLQVISKQSRDVSYDTSSNDPILRRSRVFVGSLNSMIVKRPDLINLYSNYGTLLGVTLFKNYAFLQFSSPNEADSAVAHTNGLFFQGQILDVKLAIKNMKNPSRGTPDTPIIKDESQSLKRTSPTPSETSDDTVLDVKKRCIEGINGENHIAATLEASNSRMNFYDHGMVDTLICGKCRYVTSNFTDFREHRKRPCPSLEKSTNRNERLQCTTCCSVFESDSDLINHLSVDHNMALYRRFDDHSPASLVDGTGELKGELKE
ncbi:RNA recognition motif domain and Zinc finger, C2H2 domain and Nucleotide-binding, alpha-beta plait domain-containing protein [Strongyloides ratti]|uniref:RNA recognition motif domain and Zinc finger, C2H2 domain and Nucleotide-binding, alpha-beta plait domain-containing protein n=1 Tax=Strongyloides ratti TaxID=34506 RepID=A0A090L2U1_STRRB|nr:RNA recognition motif domain and Zinc finger, C2H2 domain and Nucleotide-binding, alpha-beta plait domain-containing protein [Strongyloides ratti]CEF64027.1 RNA recognition motif domain and Zinc finger, C2H2 domain and Nucleotide-binding, alpha-beta plait domain-containing protein [Strongyloides ratti]